MAVTITPASPVSGLKRYRDTDSNETAETNIGTGALTVYKIVVDNTANPSTPVYTKLYDNVGPTVGTTAPTMILMTPGGVARTRLYPKGVAFATAVSFATVTGAGTAGVTGPTGDVAVDIWAA